MLEEEEWSGTMLTIGGLALWCHIDGCAWGDDVRCAMAGGRRVSGTLVDNVREKRVEHGLGIATSEGVPQAVTCRGVN